MHITRLDSLRPRGFAVVAVVFTLMALGAISATVASMSSTTHEEAPAAKPARQAYYAAEAGVRIATAEYNKASASSDRVGLLGDMDGKTFTLNDSDSEQFTLNIFSYGFRVTDTDNTASPKTITAQAINNIPLADMEGSSSTTISLEKDSMISVQDEIGDDVPVTLLRDAEVQHNENGPDTIVFSVSGGLPPASANLDYVSMAYSTKESNPMVSGDRITGLPGGLRNFPPRNGRIAIKGTDIVFTYRTLTEEEGGTVTLEGIHATGDAPTTSALSDAVVILRKTFAFQSVGTIGTGSNQTSKTLVYYDAPEDDGTSPDADDVSDSVVKLTMEDFSDFAANDRHNLHRTRYQSSQGTHPYYAAMYKSNNGQGQGSNLTEKFVKLDISNFKDQWEDDSTLHRLSYDVQIKLGTGYQLDYGALGLCVRFHKENGHDNFYAASFMKYSDWYEDYIPDDIKPPNKAGRILLVLWRQKGNARDWIAFKDITDDIATEPDQWSGDGQVVTDNTTLLMRVEEQYVQGVKVNRIKVFYGDGSDQYPDSDRNLSAPYVPYDIVAGRMVGHWEDHWYGRRWVEEFVIDGGRKRYSPSWLITGDWNPVYPPLTIADWSAARDYFSFIETSPDTYTAGGDDTRECTWDAFNDADIAPLTDADIRILSDGGTIRSREFVTPSDTFHHNSEQRAEVALHGFGRMRNANSAVTFDDLAIQFLLYD